MALTIANEIIPLHSDVDGVLRVGGTRVALETVVEAFSEGATAEEIVLRYPSLKLADVYAVIVYYLRHTPETEAYLQQRITHSEAVRRMNNDRFEQHGVRARLLLRGTRQG